MKLGIRVGAALVAVIIIASVGLVYRASDRMSRAGMAAAEAREATFETYRVAQAIKTLIHGYELTINEYYSTALKFSVYQEKAAEFKAAIDRELATLAGRNAGDARALAELNAALKQIEILRFELEGALAGENKNWDLAREALYKLNVVSVQAAQPSDLIARIASERAMAMDTVWQEHQGLALQEMRIAMLLALASFALVLLGMFRGAMPLSPPSMA